MIGLPCSYPIRMRLSSLFWCAVPALACTGACAQAFDTGLLAGQWAESVNNQFACRPGNVHHRFVLSADRKHLSFRLDRAWRIGGQEVREYGAQVLREEPSMLVIRYDDTVTGIPAGMREWELLFIGPGAYRWRATFWRRGEYNDVIGVRCAAD